ncbi:MAG: glycosyltransferase [Candidatus Bathyarchaeia archaeon]
MKINFVTSWGKECGIATYTFFLVQELRKIMGGYVTPVPKTNALNPYFKILGYRVGRSQDLVHIQFEYGIFPSAKLGRTLTAFAALPFYLGLGLGNRRVITTMHEPRKAVVAGGKIGLLYTRLLDKLIFSVSDIIVVHTQESKRLLQTVYGVKPAKLRVIPHGSYQQPRLSDKEAVKAKLGLGGKTVVTILGFVTVKKGHDLAIPLLPKIGDNVQLVIAGGPQNSQDEQYIASLKKLAEANGVSDRVTFTGYLDDLTPVLNASDVALLPYRYVTDSGVLHLLVAYRVPTLASDLAAFREVYDEYGCLDLFRVGDSEDLYEKLQVLLSDNQHRLALKAKCVDMWNATKWSAIAQKHIELYRQVLSKKA